jgi:hypothetical protein
VSRWFTEVRQGENTTILASLNGFPLARRSTTTFDTITTAGDHLIQPGENEVELVVLRAGPLGVAKLLVGRLADQAVLAEAVYPDHARVDGALTLPARVVKRFVAPDDHPVPLFARLEPEEIPREGTPAMVAPLTELEDALRRGSASDVVASLELKAQELARFHASPKAGPAGLAQEAAAFVRGPYEMSPVRREDLLFTPVAGGRAVHVTRRDGTPAVQGRPLGGGGAAYASDVALVRHQGRYRIFA